MSLLNFLTFGLLGKTPQHDHTCHCGTATVTPHETGTHGCQRFMTKAPDKLSGDRWHVDGKIITGYSLREQRGYCQHRCGCWSRHEGSENSISA